MAQNPEKYRDIPHSVTNKSPAEIDFHYLLIFKSTQIILKRIYSMQNREFDVGDRVVARNYVNTISGKVGQSKISRALDILKLDWTKISAFVGGMKIKIVKWEKK